MQQSRLLIPVTCACREGLSARVTGRGSRKVRQPSQWRYAARDGDVISRCSAILNTVPRAFPVHEGCLPGGTEFSDRQISALSGQDPSEPTNLTLEIPIATSCPLCSADGDMLAEFDVEQLIHQWQTHVGIDIAPELQGLSSIAEYRCRQCALRYYMPAAAGSEHLYEQLQGFPWYYTEQRWEHRAALRDIPRHASVLDVGCGFGGFLDLVRQERHAVAKGVDWSASAVAVGRTLGRPVIVGDVCRLADEEPNRYDAVCAFQVLEHVAHPRRFLDACVRLLRPGGRLCIAVPNDDGYMGKQRREKASLNLPPHHLSRWGRRTLMSLEGLFPLKVRRIAFEPLSEHHVPEYITAWLDSFDGKAPQGFLRTSAGLMSSRLLAGLGLRRLFRGHSTYVSYTRLP